MKYRVGEVVYIWVKGSRKVVFFGSGIKKYGYSHDGKVHSWMNVTN